MGRAIPAFGPASAEDPVLTRLRIRNFKLFDEVDLELGDRVVLIGPNNAGKTTVLQALALWEVGLKRWMERRGSGEVPAKRPGVTINRRDLIAVPVPAANLLWRDLHVRSGSRQGGKTRTENVLIQIVIDGVDWSCGLELDYRDEESFFCRPMRLPSGERMPVPPSAKHVQVAYLPPMSGLTSNETRLDRGAINVRLGEGRTADVLRNLCYQVLHPGDGGDEKVRRQKDAEGRVRWDAIVQRMAALFGSRLDEPRYLRERGEVTMTYQTPGGVRLDLSASGRGHQQTLLLLAYMAANPNTVHLSLTADRRTAYLASGGGQIWHGATRSTAQGAARPHGPGSDGSGASRIVLSPGDD